jgi:hypothetical protein
VHQLPSASRRYRCHTLVFLAPEDGTSFSHDEHGMEYLPTIVYINW